MTYFARGKAEPCGPAYDFTTLPVARAMTIKSFARHVPHNMCATIDLRTHWVALTNRTIVKWATLDVSLGCWRASATPCKWKLLDTTNNKPALIFQMLNPTNAGVLKFVQLVCWPTICRAPTNIRPHNTIWQPVSRK